MIRSARNVLFRSEASPWATIPSAIMFVAWMAVFWRTMFFMSAHHLTKAPCSPLLETIDYKDVVWCATSAQRAEWLLENRIAWGLFIGSFVVDFIGVAFRRRSPRAML